MRTPEPPPFSPMPVAVLLQRISTPSCLRREEKRPSCLRRGQAFERPKSAYDHRMKIKGISRPVIHRETGRMLSTYKRFFSAPFDAKMSRDFAGRVRRDFVILRLKLKSGRSQYVPILSIFINRLFTFREITDNASRIFSPRGPRLPVTVVNVASVRSSEPTFHPAS
jgi:hypothetical protein